MDEELKTELAEFISQLQLAYDNCKRKDYLESYVRAIELSKLILRQQGIPSKEYGQLKRLVSDSLPWNEELLIHWNRINRLART